MMPSFPKRSPSQWYVKAAQPPCFARKEAVNERQGAEGTKTRQVLAVKQSHAKMTPQEKEPRKQTVVACR